MCLGNHESDQPRKPSWSGQRRCREYRCPSSDRVAGVGHHDLGEGSPVPLGQSLHNRLCGLLVSPLREQRNARCCVSHSYRRDHQVGSLARVALAQERCSIGSDEGRSTVRAILVFCQRAPRLNVVPIEG